MLAMKLFWRAYNRSFTSFLRKKGMNSLSMVYNFSLVVFLTREKRRSPL